MVLDHERNLMRINRAAASMLGLPERPDSCERIIDKFELFLPSGELLPIDQWPAARALRGESVENWELRVRRKDTGKVAMAEVGVSSVAGRAGDPTRLIVTYRDVTEIRHKDEARARLAAIVESSEDAIIGKDDQGIITSWNAGAQTVFGYSAEEMIGRSITVLVPEDRLQEEIEILARIKRGESVEHIETVRKRKNGQFIQVSLSISPIRDASGRVVGASKIARNITERKQLESQLYQSQKMEAIGQLTAASRTTSTTCSPSSSAISTCWSG